MVLPNWYANKYPSFEDLVSHAEELGVAVTTGRFPTGAFFHGDVPVILVPGQKGELLKTWCLAHELGHLMQHTGPKGRLMWAKDEWAANRWAACALIPKSRVVAHGNASLDAFIGALSVHYEWLPPEDCEARRLAAHIARHRLRCLETTG